MTHFPDMHAYPAGDGPAALSGAPLTFGSRELVLDVGFVSSRIRLFNLMNRSWLTDVNGFVELLAALPVPAGQVLPVPRMVRVRLEEPMTGAGMVMLPIHLEAVAGSSLPLRVLELGLTLRAGRSGDTYLRLNGAVQPPFAMTGPDAFDPSPAQRAIAAGADSWLARVAELLSSPADLSCRHPAQAGLVAGLRRGADEPARTTAVRVRPPYVHLRLCPPGTRAGHDRCVLPRRRR